MRIERALCVLSFLTLSACSGSTSTSSPTPPATTGTPASPSQPSESPAPPVTNHPDSTIEFTPSDIFATRAAFHAGCKEANPPFTDDDLFTLQPVGAPTMTATDAKIASIAIVFKRTVGVDVPVDLILGGPSHGATFGDGSLQAHAPDENTGADVTVFPPNFASGAPPSSSLTSARVTVLALADKDGAPLTARVELRFSDGGVLDATYSAPLAPAVGACSG